MASVTHAKNLTIRRTKMATTAPMTKYVPAKTKKVTGKKPKKGKVMG